MTIILGIAGLTLVAVAASPAIPSIGAWPPSLPAPPARVYSVAQFVQPGTGPLWTTRHRATFLVRGILQRAAMQPVADFILSDSGSMRTWDGGLALSSGPANPVVRSLAGVAMLRSFLPPTADNPLLGKLATYHVLWIGCTQSGCARSPWQLVSGGA